MEWWVWALIGAGVLALGILKLTLFSRILQKKKKAPPIKDDD